MIFDNRIGVFVAYWIDLVLNFRLQSKRTTR